jgi:hypothetical protein
VKFFQNTIELKIETLAVSTGERVGMLMTCGRSRWYIVSRDTVVLNTESALGGLSEEE